MMNFIIHVLNLYKITVFGSGVSLKNFGGFDKIDVIQNRVIKYFMGALRFTPILNLFSD